jgi:RpiR family transcriptional regulator, carbohydrate utilization regulator
MGFLRSGSRAVAPCIDLYAIFPVADRHRAERDDATFFSHRMKFHYTDAIACRTARNTGDPSMDILRVVPHSTTDTLARIRAMLGTLPDAQLRVGTAILAEPDWSVRANVEEIARRAAVSAPTVVRFCRAVGFEGLSDFKLQLAQSLAVGTPYLHRAVDASDDVPSLLHKILYGAAAVLTNLESQLDAGAIRAAIDKLATARRIECYSVGSVSGFLAADAQARFARLGLASNAWPDAHMQMISAASLSPRDVVLAISHVGRMPTLLEAVALAREQGATVIGLTRPGTPLAEQCTIAIGVVVPEDATTRVGTEAYLAGQILLEALMVGVGLRLGPSALAGLKRVRAVLRERGVDNDVPPALQHAWSEAERATRKKKKN